MLLSLLRLYMYIDDIIYLRVLDLLRVLHLMSS